MHVLESGYEQPGRPCVLLLHGFPELAYSWRKLMPELARAGFHVLAPDQRGYGRTTGWNGDYAADLSEFRMMNLVRDALGLVFAMGHSQVAAVVGHDFGSPVAAWCALVRPDVFRSVALMSAPFSGPPALPLGGTGRSKASGPPIDMPAALAALPRPRKHYQWYYSTPEADGQMRHCPQGIADFLRAYYHVKSADWDGNRPHPLAGWQAESMSVLPTYYVMDLSADMAATVAPFMPSPAQVAACAWLTQGELQFYADEYARTGFQGGLQWYRCGTSGRFVAEHQLYAGRTIDVPSCFIAGEADWGVYQKPGEFEAMQSRGCTDMRDCRLIPAAGHWVQQEQPAAVLSTLLPFIQGTLR
jgi:pimeloyl-ACP methyl ester carboxylesterase